MATPALQKLAELRNAMEEHEYEKLKNRYKNATTQRTQNQEAQARAVNIYKSIEDVKVSRQNALMKRVLEDPRLMREIAVNQNPMARFNPETGKPLPDVVRMRQDPTSPLMQNTLSQFLPGSPIPPGDPSRQPASIIPGRRNPMGQRTGQGFIAQGSPRTAPEIPQPSQPQLGRSLRQESTDNLEKLANGNVGGLGGFVGRALGQRTNVDRGTQAEAISVLRSRGIPFKGNFVPEPIANANEEELNILNAFEGNLTGDDAKDNLNTFEEQKMALADPEIGKILILYGKKENKPLAKNIKKK